MKTKTLLLTAAFAASIAPAARAQSVTGFQADRFNPSERGSEWFALDTLDMRGGIRPAVGVVGEWASGVFRLKNPDGSAGTTVVDQQMYLHAGASLVRPVETIVRPVETLVHVPELGSEATCPRTATSSGCSSCSPAR